MRLQSWNKILLMICVMALLVDPIFFYIPQIDANRKCLVLDKPLKITTCAVRTFLDLSYFVLHLMLRFRPYFIVPHSSPFPRIFGELVVVDSEAVAKSSLSKFIIDVFSIIPLPQVFVLFVPLLDKEYLKYIVLIQYVPRIVRMYPFFREVTRTAGNILTDKAWAAAAYNLLLFMLASHVVGSVWYLLSIESEIRCWSQELKNANLSAATKYMRCGHQNSTVLSLLKSSCPLKNPDEIDDPAAVFNFGIFIDAFRSRVVESTTNFPQKILYCFWWGLRNVCSLGQDLKTSTFIEEIFFTVFIAIFGLILFALLIGNVQRYLQSMQSTAVKAEEMRVNIQNIDKWMSQRKLPDHLKKRIKRYEHYKWEQHEGVDEETLIHSLPKDLRRDIKRHLCLHLLVKVPVFRDMDDRLLNALCDRMKPVLYTENSYIVREGDPVDEMVFIIRGNLASMAKIVGRISFLDSFVIKAGGFCGEELLTWAFDSLSSPEVPISTRTVESISEVEAFALMANDLKLVASRFPRFHEHQHTFRFYSSQWRTWAACFIQAAWRRHRRRKLEKALREAEDRLQDALAKEEGSCVSFGATIYASRFAANALRSLRKRGRSFPVSLGKEHYKSQDNGGVDEETLIHNLPKDLRRDIKGHLCLDLLKKVPMFAKMDEQLLEALSDRLKAVLYAEKSHVIREGDPVDQMLLIMRGNLASLTTNGGRTGFCNSFVIKAGDFCGEELLTWAFDPNSSSNLPISTRTVESISEVEAFALMPNDLKLVASQFRRLHDKHIQHTFSGRLSGQF